MRERRRGKEKKGKERKEKENGKRSSVDLGHVSTYENPSYAPDGTISGKHNEKRTKGKNY